MYDLFYETKMIHNLTSGLPSNLTLLHVRSLSSSVCKLLPFLHHKSNAFMSRIIFSTSAQTSTHYIAHFYQSASLMASGLCFRFCYPHPSIGKENRVPRWNQVPFLSLASHSYSLHKHYLLKYTIHLSIIFSQLSHSKHHVI